MDIKTQIQQEAERRYPNGTMSTKLAKECFKEGAEWLLPDIEGLKASNEELRYIALNWQNKAADFQGEKRELQSQLSLSEGRVKELEALYERLSKLTSNLLDQIDKLNTTFSNHKIK